MRNVTALALLAIGGLLVVGCGSKEEADPQVVAPPPEIKQVDPGMVSPEERARQGTQGQEAGDGG